MTLRPAALAQWFALSLGITTGCGGAPATTSEPHAGAAAAPAIATSSAFAHATTGSLLASSTSFDKDLVMSQEAPMSLTASDGSGLELTRLEAKAFVQGPLAFTELHLYFHNPEDRIREGTFSVTLPTGAALSRFAMENDGGWMEAEVVEKMQARRAYEDFLHRKQDPALLEQAAGNQFSARVFPIPARGAKHLVISYSQELTRADAPYALPLRGLPTVGAVDASVTVARGTDPAGWTTSTLSQRSWKPDRDFVVGMAAPAGGKAAAQAVGAGEFFAARVVVPGEQARAPMASLAVLVDSSASRALGYAAQIDALEDAIAALRQTYGDGFTLDVAAFDQEVQPVFHGRAADFGAAQLATLRQRQALGASNLGNALDWLATSAKAERVLLLGDGVVTAGARDEALAAKAKALAASGARRLDVALVGAIHDRAGARALAASGLASTGVVVELAEAGGADELARRMALPVRSDLAVTVDGADWVWPATAAQAQPGDEMVVYAAIPGRTKATAGKATVKLGGVAQAFVVEAASEPLVTRASAQAEIARLEATRDAATTPAARQAARDRIVTVSVAQRVLSSETALLVLETEADYVRFGIPRTALRDVMVIGKGGVELQHRAAPVVLAVDATVAVADDVEKDSDKGMKGDASDSADDGVDGRIGGTGAAEERMAGAAAGGASRDEAEGVSLRSGAPSASRAAEIADVVTETASTSGRISVSARGAAAASDQPAPEPMEARRAIERPAPRPMPPPAPPPPPPGGLAAAAVEARPSGPPALTGRMATVMASIAAKQPAEALREAMAWHREAPGDVLALLALGEAFEASGEVGLAARAYGSIIDLFSARADLRRFAGERLERLGASARDLIIDTYQQAVADRPDHLSGHRMLAMALVRAGRHADALAAIEHGLAQDYPSDRFRGGDRILREDAGLIAAAWIAKEPAQRDAVQRRLATLGARLETAASTRFVLYWETDSNDVDFHIRDARGGHAYYSAKQLPSGGELYEDVTTGYGPECFTIPGTPSAGPYQLEIHYYSRGPMGYGMGVLEVVRHDGKGGLVFEHRPYVAMSDQAYVDLGSIAVGTSGKALPPAGKAPAVIAE